MAALSNSDRRKGFRRLHDSGCFVIPNPWDIGSAHLLEQMGFQALASSSAGFAWGIGRPDGGVPVTAVLEHLRSLVSAVRLPINADFEHGYDHDLEGMARNVSAAIETGIAGLSIEDSTGQPDSPQFDLPTAVDRIRTARAAIDRVDPNAMLIGRCESFLVGRPDLDETIRRLQAYAEAGADCLFAPGIRSDAEIAAVVAAVAPKPVNVVISWPGVTLERLAALGVRRVSVGGGLARAAWTGFLGAARALAEGRFDGFEGIVRSAELDGLFARE